ncbi:MAG: hypothetical protein LAP86_32940 [Acidobacteriia bacterium]|nr:hypothetical protein [Terriglobia bacterium]
MKSRLLTAVLLMTVMAPLLHGVASDWQSLSRIQPGDRVQVVDQKLREYTGKYVNFSETGITLQVADKEVTIPKDDVYRVTVVSRGRGRHVIRGLLIGVGIGTGIGGAVCASDSTKGSRGAIVAGGAAWGAGIGALVGAVKAPHIPIYRAPRTGGNTTR